MGELLIGTSVKYVHPPGLSPLPWEQMLALFVYAMVSCLVVNDAVNVTLIKHLVPTTVA